MALGCLEPTLMPRATENVPAMIAMTERLIAEGYAYPAEGHVLFRVKKKADYGKLARRSVDDMLAGARVDVAPYKEDPMDFVLWKPSDAATPGWDSPWGRGRPGWHLECSAMIEATMGETIDIHGGGIDLVFPHHENEIAQSEGAHHGHPLARYWMHNGFLNVEGEKMSKSLGNFVTINELLSGWAGEPWSGGALRLTMLKTHYRQPINWTAEELNKSKFELSRFANAAQKVPEKDVNLPVSDEFVDVLSDDLNTPEMLRVMRAQCAAAFEGDDESASQLLAELEFLGLVRRDILAAYTPVTRANFVSVPEILAAGSAVQALKVALINGDEKLKLSVLRQLLSKNLKAEIDKGDVTISYADGSVFDNTAVMNLIEARNAARKAKNFAESDRIRDELLAQGIVLKDGPSGTTWEVKR
jgi:cysteinyl-tRNA synthetase